MKATALITSTLLMSMVLLTLLVPVAVQPVAAQSPPSPPGSQPRLIPLAADTPVDKAFQHLEMVMDKCHQSFIVYTDSSDPCNHFAHRARLEAQDGITTMNDAFTGTVHSGATAIKNTFIGQGWGGWYLQNGVLLDDDVEPRPNWGDYPDAGYDLTGATELTFWARGEEGGETVEFFAFGVGRDPNYGFPTGKPFPGSSAKVTKCGLVGRDPGASPCFTTLTNTWQRYTIPLIDLDLSYVLGGFAWVTNDVQNNNQSITFYLDDIQYDGPSRLDDPRFLLSFETLPSGDDFDLVLKNVGFTYDNALALIAFTAAGDGERARLLADAFVYCQAHDRYYTDGRLRNTYQAGDLKVPPGWTPNGREGTCRMPGWWDPESESWFEDPEFVGSGTGNIAWAMIALLNYYEKWGGEQYLTSVITMGNWIETHTHDTRGAGGYTGGYTEWEPTPTKFLWKSTEHNIDLYVAFERLYLITNDEKWQERAQHARNFVEAMWNDGEGFYWTGTGEDGETINETVIPLDGQTWTLMAFGANERTRRAIDYAESNHHATYAYDNGLYEGFDFNTDRDGPWAEGTGQMVVSYCILDEDVKAQHYLTELEEIQATDPNGNGKGIVAAPFDAVTTGFNWEYFQRLHVGATAWFIFAELCHNPYWPPSIRSLYFPIVVREYH
jgi:hypothetical protein